MVVCSLRQFTRSLTWSDMRAFILKSLLKQMPGFGSLDYAPIIAALKEIKYGGLSEIFMHPVPRGVPVLDTPEKISGAINKSRAHLTKLLS